MWSSVVRRKSWLALIKEHQETRKQDLGHSNVPSGARWRISIQIFLFWASGRVGVCSGCARGGPGPKTQKKTENDRKRSKKHEKARKSESAREFGARARNSLFSSSGRTFSAFSGLWPEIRYFRTPETHFLAFRFQHFRGSGPKFAIFELLRPIFAFFGALTGNLLFSSS